MIPGYLLSGSRSMRSMMFTIYLANNTTLCLFDTLIFTSKWNDNTHRIDQRSKGSLYHSISKKFMCCLYITISNTIKDPEKLKEGHNCNNLSTNLNFMLQPISKEQTTNKITKQQFLQVDTKPVTAEKIQQNVIYTT